ncbi:hypothetical protein GCM10011516_27520 [Sphingobacterium cellulitidis]|uniref:Uncharacterized protein n=1 Tax=Sphingobacterium cellulitidis TaxID=1768011 RepID=A0A8H9G0F9_9SPHI|nr:hypothetical protein GCM10011516_27520 [Sphingobacterium soli]
MILLIIGFIVFSIELYKCIKIFIKHRTILNFSSILIFSFYLVWLVKICIEGGQI